MADDQRSDCIVLLSGGIDSSACLELLHPTTNVNQGTSCRLWAACRSTRGKFCRAIASHYGVPISVIRVAGGRSKLDGELLGRNTFLVFTAIMDIDKSAAIIALGIHAGTPYYDVRPHFCRLFKLLSMDSVTAESGFSPVPQLAKTRHLGILLPRRVPVDLTYSCEKGLAQACGICLSCEIERHCMLTRTSTIRIRGTRHTPTPLLIPSFSSKGFARAKNDDKSESEISSRHLRIPDRGFLISAYDIAYGHIPHHGNSPINLN